MGQYRQWLHYRQVDQQLHTLKEHLLTELQRLREQDALDTSPLDADNRIVQALLFYAKQPSPATAEQQDEATDTQHSDTISLLFERSRLPNLEPLFESNAQPPQPAPPAQPTKTFAPLPPIPHQPQPSYLEEANGLADSQQTEPQTALPWWLRKAALAAPGNGLDPHSVRTNQLVQRWLERWGRQENEGTNGDVYPSIMSGEEASQ